jgi:hypothetical protein
MTLTVKETVVSGEHWYLPDGKPRYTIIGANGKERATTLRDARKEGLLPSVTTILNVAAKPMLNTWLQKQAVLAALTLPRADSETDDDYVARVLKDAKEEGMAAANAGTAIHDSIEKYLSGQEVKEHFNIVVAVKDSLNAYFGKQEWICEKSFANSLGFAGKCDLHVAGKLGIVCDVKTKEFTDPNKVEAYEDNLLQLAAYRQGLGIPLARCANIFVSRNVPGLVAIKTWDEEDLKRGWEMFQHLMSYWYLKNKYEVKNAE